MQTVILDSKTVLPRSNLREFLRLYIPCVVSLLGVVMYLRLGWVLGQLGLALTLVTISLSALLVVFTALSLSALASNRPIGNGGVYTIISRSLGVEAGAAIGLPLFIAQMIGVTFCLTGLAEAVRDTLPSFPGQITAIGALLFIVLLTTLKPKWASIVQLAIMSAVVISLLSFFFGHNPGSDPTARPAPTATFWVAFAVMFPAVTGLDTAISMTANLKRPGSLLAGASLTSILTAYLIYLAIPISLWCMMGNSELLRTDTFILRRVASVGSLVTIGLWAVALASALSNFLTADETLRVLAADRILPRIFGEVTPFRHLPPISVWLITAGALVGILAWDLNAVGTVLSMFSLTAYALLNFSAGMQELISPPSWQPRFRVPWFCCFLGFIGCVAVMFMINPGATFIALGISLIVYLTVKRRSLKARWGDMRLGMLMQLAHSTLHHLAESQPDERTWKPNILVLSGNPPQRWYLVELAKAVSNRRSFVTIASILTDQRPPDALAAYNSRVKHYLQSHGIVALVKTRVAETSLDGCLALIRDYGFGPLAPNTLLLGPALHSENYLGIARITMLATLQRQNLVIVRDSTDPTVLDEGARIDLWWRGQHNNLGLMLALAYLMCRGDGWRDTQLNLMTIVDDPDKTDQALSRLSRFIECTRIDVRATIVLSEGKDPFHIIRDQSADADLVFLGLRSPAPDETPEGYADYYADLMIDTVDLPPLALVLATESIDFLRIFQE